MAFKKTYSAQTALKTCADHEHEELDMYCRTCKKPICTMCIKKKHINHDWDRMKKIAKELRMDSLRQKLEAESISKSMKIGTTTVLDHISSNNEETFNKNMSDLESTRKEMHELVDSTIDAMQKKCRTHRNKLNTAVQKKREEMTPKVERLQFLLAHMEEAAADYSDFDVIEFHDELKDLLRDLGVISVIPLSFHDSMVYNKKKLEKTIIVSMLGSVDTVTKSPSSMSVVSVSQFSCEHPVNCICPVSNEEAWIHLSSTARNVLVDFHGKEKKFSELCRCYNFDVSEDGTMFFGDNLDTLTVKSVDESGRMKTMFSTAPLKPLTISVTLSGDLLVSLVDEDKYERTSSSRRLVRRVTKTGTIIREYEYDDDGKTPLFNKPLRPKELNNGNMCVINELPEKSGTAVGIVFVFENYGNIKFKYSGTSALFNPLDLCCDMLGNILITDVENKCVHLINSEGKFVQHLLIEKTLNFRPVAIALFYHRLWISSFDDGELKVFSVFNH